MSAFVVAIGCKADIACCAALVCFWRSPPRPCNRDSGVFPRHRPFVHDSSSFPRTVDLIVVVPWRVARWKTIGITYVCWLGCTSIHVCGPRWNPSDVVQQTLLKAHRSELQQSGTGEGGRVAWLRRILANTIADEVRRFTAGVRDIRLERSLADAVDLSASHVEQWLAANQTSPSGQAIGAERSLRLAAALCQLPPRQQLAVELHHFHGLPLAEIAQQLACTQGAVGALLVAGLNVCGN